MNGVHKGGAQGEKHQTPMGLVYCFSPWVYFCILFLQGKRMCPRGMSANTSAVCISIDTKMILFHLPLCRSRHLIHRKRFPGMPPTASRPERGRLGKPEIEKASPGGTRCVPPGAGFSASLVIGRAVSAAPLPANRGKGYTKTRCRAFQFVILFLFYTAR